MFLFDILDLQGVVVAQNGPSSARVDTLIYPALHVFGLVYRLEDRIPVYGVVEYASVSFIMLRQMFILPSHVTMFRFGEVKVQDCCVEAVRVDLLYEHLRMPLLEV